MGIGDGRRVLVTGGAVHGKIDAVKLVTNKFRGGTVAALADSLALMGFEVVWLSTKDARMPVDSRVKRLVHDGIDDYARIVAETAPSCDGVFLGAAVANLVPVKTIQGKFPSHNYKPGDIIPIDFMIAPRIVDMVRKVAPRTALVACKLLSGVSDDELVAAAWGICEESGAVLTVANDPAVMDRKLLVWREGSVQEETLAGLPAVIAGVFSDRRFETIRGPSAGLSEDDVEQGLRAVDACRARGGFVEKGGVVFGAAAVMTESGMVCTARGKREDSELTLVTGVDFENLAVTVPEGLPKASLNAPLLWRILHGTGAKSVLHGHVNGVAGEIQPYAPPGTLRDSTRPVSRSFEIDGHGFFIAEDAS